MAVYNGFDGDRLGLALESLGEQRGVQVEICLAESNAEPCFAQRARDMGVRYAFSPPNECANPGRVRNAALAIASGEFVYSTDADIILPPGFIAGLLSLPAGVWIHPPKRRLPKDQFATFDALAREQGLQRTVGGLWSDDYFASLDQPIQYRLSEKEGKRYTCVSSDYSLWRSSPALRERAPEFWDSTQHRGGTFASRALWHEVGGYADVYRTWGFEDADVQWKLSTRQATAEIPNVEQFRVLHLDHPKTYFSPQHNRENKQRFEARKASAPESINHDRLRLETTQP